MIEGQLVRLRALEPGDRERCYTWINDGEVTYFLQARYPMSNADEDQWLERVQSNNFQRGVTLAIETKDGQHIGNIGLENPAPEEHLAELGIMIGDKSFWSNGYGTDAITTLLRFAFEHMNLNRVWLRVFEFNERARACYRKCGFREEGRLRQHFFKHGRYWDVLAMGILRDEFQAPRKSGQKE